jgi:hypothetical protein
VVEGHGEGRKVRARDLVERRFYHKGARQSRTRRDDNILHEEFGGHVRGICDD